MPMAQMQNIEGPCTYFIHLSEIPRYGQCMSNGGFSPFYPLTLIYAPLRVAAAITHLLSGTPPQASLSLLLANFILIGYSVFLYTEGMRNLVFIL